VPELDERAIHALREQFPITRRWVFLNHAGVCPLSLPVAQAMREYLDDSLRNGPRWSEHWYQRLEQGRRTFARLVGADPAEIAYVKNTTQGVLIAASSIPWQRGDNCLIFDQEFPANVYPWLALEASGVQVRMVRPVGGRITPELIAEHCDERTRCVALSFVQFANGFRADMEAIGKFCRERKIFFFADIIQGAGVIPLDVRACCIDMASCDGHKWLLGPEGMGFFFCRREILDELRPANIGWYSVVEPEKFTEYDLTLRPDARRFEEGSLNIAGGFGLCAAVNMLARIGPEACFARLLALTDEIIARARERQFEILSPVATTAERSGIVVFRVPGCDNARLVRQLADKHRIQVAFRGGGVRVSPHIYNTVEEIACLFSAIDELLGGG